MKILVLIRHGQSEWNLKNLFTGWTDVDLSPNGIQEAIYGGKVLKQNHYDFDICYTSLLKRAIHTANYILDELDRAWIPMVKDYRLNERHYGALQGLNKAETAKKYGEKQVLIWRRSYDVPPLKLQEDDKRNPKFNPQYRDVKEELPLCESLKDTVMRVVPYYEKVIKKDIAADKRVLIAAHGNSLRALIKHLDKVSDKDIVTLNIPTGVPLVYELDDNLVPIRHYYLCSEEDLKNKMQSVRDQGKAN